jgi:hypothetical protein
MLVSGRFKLTRHLQVDALCIIQASESDKAREIGMMAKVYDNAHITIVASIANCASEGYLGRQPANQAIVIPFRVSKHKFGIVTVRKIKLKETEPIEQRA